MKSVPLSLSASSFLPARFRRLILIRFERRNFPPRDCSTNCLEVAYDIPPGDQLRDRLSEQIKLHRKMKPQSAPRHRLKFLPPSCHSPNTTKRNSKFQVEAETLANIFAPLCISHGRGVNEESGTDDESF